MIKAIILDDESNCVEVLEYELGRLKREIEVVATCTKPKEALKIIATSNFDVLFLDIEMPGMNAFQFLDALGPITAKIIFTTAYDQFALKAFRYYALDYLLKPISKEDLEEALSRIESPSIVLDKDLLHEVHNRISFPNATFNKIAVPVENGFQMVNIADIIYCEADSNYSKIYLVNDKVIVISKTLKYLDKLLSSHGFYRIHQSALINMNYIAEYTRKDGGTVTLEGGKVVAVSRANKKEFERFLTNR